MIGPAYDRENEGICVEPGRARRQAIKGPIAGEVSDEFLADRDFAFSEI
jgi:hypothetical protein